MEKILVVAISVATLLLIDSCAQGNKSKEATDKPIAQVTEVTPTSTPTVTATPTANPNAKPVPGSCLMLEERYCRTVKFITSDGYQLAAYELPVGTPIFSPYRGVITTTGEATAGVGGPKIPVVFFSTVKTDRKESCLCGTDYLDGSLVGGIEKKSLLTVKPISAGDEGGILTYIGKKQILARAGETNITIDPPWNMLNTYNLVMYFSILRDTKLSNAKTKAVFGIPQFHRIP